MPKVDPKKKCRGWLFTLNNYSAQEIEDVKVVQTRYTIFALETCPSTGTPHIQGYFFFKNAVRFSTVTKLLPRARFESANGSPQQNMVYCSKTGDYTEIGVLPVNGKRTDLSNFVQEVKASDTVMDETTLLEDYSGIVARYPTFVDRVNRYYHPPLPLEELNNLWIFGVPGSGKTWEAAQLLEGDHYVKAPNKWFCGYSNQKVLIIEDLGPEHSGMAYNLKMWADKAPFTAQTKGSSMYIRPKMIVVTSNYSIEDMGWDSVTTLAVKRRFKIIEKNIVYN